MALYQEAFPNKKVTIYEGHLPKLRAQMVQFADGLYPVASLWSKTTNGPSPIFHSICAEIRRIAEASKIPQKEWGVITAKKLLPSALDAFPEIPPERFLNEGKLRGSNALTDCKAVAVIGCQPISYDDLAWNAAAIYNIDIKPSELMKQRPTLEVVHTESENERYYLKRRDFGDPRLNSVFDMVVSSELIQAIGRARPYDDNAAGKLVLLYSNQPLPMPMTKIVKRREHLAGLGMETTKTICDRVFDAFDTLTPPFGYAEIAAALELSEVTLKGNPTYKDAIENASALAGLAFKRGGGGRAGQFLEAA